MAERFKHLREKVLKISQNALADEIGVSQSFISKIESEEQPPNIEVIVGVETSLEKRGLLSSPFLVREWL